jgi:hypothetical protein
MKCHECSFYSKREVRSAPARPEAELAGRVIPASKGLLLGKKGFCAQKQTFCKRKGTCAAAK